MSDTRVPTLFPKISQHVSAVVKGLREMHQDCAHPDEDLNIEPIPIVGSVKLHGTHADILVYSNDTIILQSKNVGNITPANDNQGFAAAMVDKTAAILDLRDQCLACWKVRNSNTSLDPQYPIVIAGEWIGVKIQKDVAISQLSRRFVILSVNVNGSWIQDTQHALVEAPSASIYNKSRGGTFHATLYPEDITRTLSEIEPLAEAVAESCPFAASFGVQGDGEGIVWKPAPAYLNSNAALWFKTKGGRFRPTFAPAPKSIPRDQQEKHDAADAVAAIWCTGERLQQAWDFLSEVGVVRDMKALGRFLKWVQSDILVEEKAYIQEYRVDEAMLRISIAKIAKVWYMESVNTGE